MIKKTHISWTSSFPRGEQQQRETQDGMGWTNNINREMFDGTLNGNGVDMHGEDLTVQEFISKYLPIPST